MKNGCERVEKDLKKLKNAALEKELAYLQRAKAWLESEKPLREMEISEDEKKLVKGFAFLSEKPMIYVENIGEDQLDRLRHPEAHATLRPNTEQTIICGKLEAEMAELPPDELKTFLADYRLTESGAGALDSHDVSAAWSDFILHRRRRRMPRLDDHTRTLMHRMPPA